MIRIARGAAPEVLLTAGAAACAALCALVERDGDKCSLTFKDRIFGHASVQEALIAMQYAKCCYCESKVDRGTIDHYRPKGAIYQARRECVSSRGYYWLAYAWDNLLLACNDCNTRFKHQNFPLEDPTRRVLSHRFADQIGAERPLLLDPTRDDPDVHISFRGPTPVPRTRRGRETIDTLKLDRPFLEAERQRSRGLLRTLLAMLDTVRAGVNVSGETVRDVCEHIARFSTASQPYAGMIRSELRTYFGPAVELPLTTARLLEWVTDAVPDGVHQSRGSASTVDISEVSAVSINAHGHGVFILA